MRFICAVLVLICLLALPGGAQANFKFKVTSVAANDTLNIRKDHPWGNEIDYKTVVGELGPSAAGIIASGLSVKIDGTRWRQIFFQGGLGWVSGKYLAIDSSEPREPTVGDALTCAGTEPFWSLDMDDDKATFDREFAADGASARKFTTESTGARGTGHAVGYAMTPLDGGEPINALVGYSDERNDLLCSDGMSDHDYAYEVFVFHRRMEWIVHGCCYRKR